MLLRRQKPRPCRIALSLTACVSSTIGEAAVLTRAQPQSIPRQDDAAPALRFTTRRVQANVVVTDKHGNPIAGLSKDDFSLLDDQKPQEIRVFAVFEYAGGTGASRGPTATVTPANHGSLAPPFRLPRPHGGARRSKPDT